jgi:5-methylcytosine-specific restriction endonuclease McrA
MKPLDQVKAKFLEIFPVEDNVREKRFQKAGYKCEMCGDTKLLHMHHIIETEKRRKFFERLFTVRIICHNCHIEGKKADTVTHYRKELAKDLQKWFTNEEIRTIIGKDNLF